MLPPARVTVGKNVGLHLSWFVYRGAGAVTFDPDQVKPWEDTRAGANSPWAPLWTPPEMPADGKVVVHATFTEPGTYILRGLADDGALFGSRRSHRDGCVRNSFAIRQPIVPDEAPDAVHRRCLVCAVGVDSGTRRAVACRRGCRRHRRDSATGKVTIRALRLTTPIRIDGRLDEALYSDVSAISDFVQMEPNGGQASEREDRGVGRVRPAERLRVVSRVGESSRPDDRQRNAARQQQHSPGRLRRVLAGHVFRSPERAPIRSEPDWRTHRRTEHQRTSVQRRLEPGLGPRCRKIRGGLDG